MKSHSSVLWLSLSLSTLATNTLAQELNLPALNLNLCSPLTESGIDDAAEKTDDLLETNVTRLYDDEIRVPMISEQEVMDALYEEKWDVSTREPILRNDLCPSQPNYVVHWADINARNEAGQSVLLAQGAFSFKKDGTFEFLFDKRFYKGRWEFKDGRMNLQAEWMDGGKTVIAPVEKVQTPVEFLSRDGETVTYFEEGYRVGWIRFMRIETTTPGQFTECICSN